MKNKDLVELINEIRKLPIGDQNCTGYIESIMDDYGNIEMLVRFVSEEDMIRMTENPDKECWEYTP